MTIPLKCLDLDDPSGQLKLKVGLYIFLILYTVFIEELAPSHWQFERGNTILLTVWNWRPNFNGYLREDAQFYLVNLRVGSCSFSFFQKLWWLSAAISLKGPCST